MGRVLGLRSVIYLLFMGGVAAWSWIGSGQSPRIFGARFWLIPALTLDLFFAWSARRRFLANFRAIAANPSDYGTARAMSAVEAGPSKHQTRRPHEAAPVRNKLSFPARRKNWVTLGITVLFLVSAITIGYRYSIERKVQNRLKALQRAGLPITVEEWNRRRAPLTNEVNAAEVIERAIPALVAVRWLPRSIQRNLPGWREESSRPDPIPHEMQQAIASVLSSNQSALAVLHAAPSLKAARYAWAGTLSVTQIQGFWTITQLLEWEVFLRAEEGDVPGAMDSLGRLLDLGRALAREPGMSVQWIKATSIKRAFSAMQWLLTRRALTETELETLQQSLAQVADRTNLEPALTELRCLAVDSYRTLSVGEQTVSGPGGPPPMELTRLYLQNRIRHWTGATDRELLAFLDELDEFARIVRAALPLRFKRAEELVPKSASAISVWNSRYVFKYLITPDAVFEAQRRTALTSLAVERFRVHHAGRLPDSLADVGSPENTEMLHDPCDGRLLRYKMLPKGYCVYSVGVNGKDDGGADPQGVPWAKTANDDISFSVQR